VLTPGEGIMTVKKFVNNFEEYFVVWTLAGMTILVFVQVVMRYVFSYSLSWSEELSRYVFLWLSWVGASYAVKEGSHFRVEMFANLIKGKHRRRFEIAILIIWFIFSFFLTLIGTQLVLFLVDTHQVSAAMRMPMAIPYASVPASCLLMCVRLIIEICKILRGKEITEKDVGSLEGGI
jgi:TRAP-type C4-dicarboxylate transport system permease small subunit